jgi:mono/diheme cytochrome c family protein
MLGTFVAMRERVQRAILNGQSPTVKSCWRQTVRWLRLSMIAAGIVLTWFETAGVKRAWSQTTEAQPSQIEQGRALIKSLGCVVCHDIKEHETGIKAEAPNLTYEGDMVQRDWLFGFLTGPHGIRPAIKGRMPDFRLTDREALAITEYLGSLLDPEPPKALGQPPPISKKLPPQEIEAAKKLMSKDFFDCFNCHVFGEQKPKGKPDEWAPDLSRVRSRINPDFLFKWFQAPDRYRPGTKMPAFFPDKDSGPEDILGGDETKQAGALRDYLASIGKVENFPAYAAAKASYPNTRLTDGRTLLKSLNCTGCHEMAVLPEGRKVGPNLTYQGSRVRKEWLIEFLRAPYTIKPEYGLMGSPTRMPTFRFSEAELNAVVEYIMQVLIDKMADPNASIDATLAKQGQKLFREKTCDNCHRVGLSPGGIGPELTDAGKRLQPGWVINFIQKPEHYLETRMPNLKVSPEEAKALTAYVLGPKN